MLDAETLEKGIAMIADPDAAEAEGDSADVRVGRGAKAKQKPNQAKSPIKVGT